MIIKVHLEKKSIKESNPTISAEQHRDASVLQNLGFRVTPQGMIESPDGYRCLRLADALQYAQRNLSPMGKENISEIMTQDTHVPLFH